MVSRTPCNRCGGSKNGHRGWYCKPCNDALDLERRAKRSLCGDVSEEHAPWSCQACQKIKRARQSEAALRGAAKRRENNPGWAKPWNAQRFWQGRAQSMVAAAKRQGLLPLLDGTIACTDCGDPAQEYDHRDYGRPLDVQPVCRSCNKRRGTAKWPSVDQFNFPKIGQQERAA